MRIIFSAGGTGGHLYPALALADYIKEHSDSEILFVGSSDRIEAEKVPLHGYDFIGLNMSVPSGNLIRRAKGYRSVFKNVDRCVEIIDDFNPDVVIGFGGYTSYSIIKAAQKRKVPTLLHEQNSIIGKSNKVLLKKVDALICAYDLRNQIGEDKVHLLGNPTSYAVSKSETADLKEYDLDDKLKTILIVMGSQGSQTIDDIINDLIDEFSFDGYQVIYVCGQDYYERYQYLVSDKPIKILAYENKMVSLIKACDLIVSRAGASAITEIVSANKPSILIPSIHVTNNHQYHNALSLEKGNCSIIVEENENLKENLLNEIELLINDDEKMSEMIDSTKLIEYGDSAMNIYNLMKKVVELNSAK